MCNWSIWLFFNISVMNEPFLKHIIEYRLRTRRAQPSTSTWRAASGTPRKQIKAHVTWSNGTPVQYSCLENPMDGGAWWAAVHGVAKSRTRLSDFTFTFHFHALEKEMAAHSSVLVWRIPGTGEPGGLLSVGSHRVGHDWSDLAAAAAVSATGKSNCPWWGKTSNQKLSPSIVMNKFSTDMGDFVMALTISSSWTLSKLLII